MAYIESVTVGAEATFGRDGAMFEGLLDFVSQLSLVLWGVVVITAVVRFVGIRIFRRLAVRGERAGVATSGAVLSAAALSGSGGQMAAVAAGGTGNQAPEAVGIAVPSASSWVLPHSAPLSHHLMSEPQVAAFTARPEA